MTILTPSICSLILTLAANPSPSPATYHVRLITMSPPKFAVTASLPINGLELVMDTTRPAGLPELDARGWPALISNLRVSDAAGGVLGVTGAGAAGWKLERPHTGRLAIEYEVDYSLLAAHGWPAPRETGMPDTHHLVLVGRSIFITTREPGPRTVTFALPVGWRPVTPWGESAAEAKDLVQNLFVLTRSAPDTVIAGGFSLHVIPMGHWRTARKEIRRVLDAVVPRLVALMRTSERGNYLVVLLPTVDQGGESFRNSFAMTVASPPSRANSPVWGGTLAHEIFHYWNGWRLAGSDYASSQWFQEGFTEYAANVSMVAGGLIEPDDFLEKLSEHLVKYRQLKTPLEAGGSRKGPPLYSAGALVAFSWDVLIRQTTGGKRSLGDFFETLWRQTDRGRRSYEWNDLRSALETAAPRDWDSFFTACIRGSEPLPLGEILPLAGLRLEETGGGAPRIIEDPAASASSKSLWRALVQGR